MQTKREYRDRDDTEVAVLDALAGRSEEGMTVFELRAVVEEDIDDIETALADLKAAGLITVENEDDPLRIFPDDRVVPGDTDEGEDPSLIEQIRDRLGI